MGISWLVSGLTFVVALIIIVIVAKVLCNKERKPSELERETRTCEFLFYLQPLSFAGDLNNSLF